MKDLNIDQYLAELNVCVDDLGGRVKLIGLLPGGLACPAARRGTAEPKALAQLKTTGSVRHFTCKELKLAGLVGASRGMDAPSLVARRPVTRLKHRRWVQSAARRIEGIFGE